MNERTRTHMTTRRIELAAIRADEDRIWGDMVCEAIIPGSTDLVARAIREYETRAAARVRLARRALATTDLVTVPMGMVEDSDGVVHFVKLEKVDKAYFGCHVEDSGVIHIVKHAA